MKSLLLGVDIGTYSSKGVLATETGRVVANAVAEHELAMPRPGWAEHDAEKVWWSDFLSITKRLLASDGVKPDQIAGIAVSTISPAVVPVDSNGRALRPAILYGIDTRATAEITDLARETGGHFDSQSGCPKILWIRRKEPEVWSRTRRIVNGSGFFTLRLTGEATIDVYDATVFAPLFDTRDMRWSAAFESVVAPVSMMPRITWTSELAGRVTREAATLTGLAEGTPVISGTADAAAEAISAGLADDGDMMLMYGSSTFFILKTPSLLTPKGFWGTRFLEKDSFAVAGGTATAGSLTRWFRDTFASGETSYEALADLAAGSPAGANGLVVLPYFSGERTPLHDPEARGMVFGLTVKHSRADIYRAFLESVGHSVRHNIEALAVQDCAARRILAVGGGTRNPLWMQIVSDIAGITQVVPQQQAGASYGDAFLAGLGIGLFSGMKDLRRWVQPGASYSPQAGTRALYDQYHALYRKLYNDTSNEMHELSRLAASSGG
ncbi:MAG TPA: FGGY-family carbohydrate kinase [Spirochaetia bacterium]|nr:FGGY-family carbohydrate kinase [Spirochaetia bacterium]